MEPSGKSLRWSAPMVRPSRAPPPTEVWPGLPSRRPSTQSSDASPLNTAVYTCQAPGWVVPVTMQPGLGSSSLSLLSPTGWAVMLAGDRSTSYWLGTCSGAGPERPTPRGEMLPG